MGNRIVISESQYSRLFLNEQELPPSFKKGLDKDKQLNLNDPNGLEGWLKNGQVDDEGVNNVDKKGGNEDVSNDNYFNTPNVIEKLPFYLENAPEWFDKESARFLDDPMGSGGVYVDKYGSTYGEWNSDRKKPLSNDEKKKINDFKRESDQIKRNVMMSAMEKIVPLTQDEKLSLLNKKYSNTIGDTNKSIEYGIKQRSGLVYNPYTKEWESPTDKPKKTSQTSTYCNYRHKQYCKKKGEVAMVKNFSGKELNSLLPNQPVPWTDSEKYPICVCGDERTKMSAGSDYDDKYLQQKREESYKTDIKRMLMMSGTITDFEKWVRDWTSQDWVDALSIVLYLIPTPLTWGIATALEVGNAGISVGKGNYGEAALRAGFLIGGFGLSKLLGSTFKASRKSADEVVSVFKKLGGKSNKEIIDFIKLERKSMSKEAKKLLDDITKQVGKDGGDKLFNFAKKNKDFINTTQKLIDGGMAEKKAIQSSLEKHFGGEMYHKLWKHVAPTTKIESGILAILYGAMMIPSYIEFKKKLKEIGATDDEIQSFFEGMIKELNLKSKEEVEKIIEESLDLVNEYFDMGTANKNIPLFNKFMGDCKQSFVNVTNKRENENISGEGISVNAGGNYDYKIYPNLTSDDSWVYTKTKNSDSWVKGDCETAKVVFKKYCKQNAVGMDKKEGVSCFNMLGGVDYQKALSYVKTNIILEKPILTDDDYDEISDGVIDGLLNFEF